MFPVFIRTWRLDGAAIVSNAVFIFISLALSIRAKKYLEKLFDSINFLAIGILVSSLWVSRLELAFAWRLAIVPLLGLVYLYIALKGVSGIYGARIRSFKQISRIIREGRACDGS
jgi:hypothetical protein